MRLIDQLTSLPNHLTDVVKLKTILLPDKHDFDELVLVFELYEADLHQVCVLCT